MDLISQLDARQLHRIVEAVDAWKVEGDLGRLVSAVEFLLSSIENLDKSKRLALRGEWEALEQIYSYAQAMRGGMVSPESAQRAMSHANDLRTLAESMLNADATDSRL